MDKNPVGWFEIYVQDLNRARKFYETVFKIELRTLNTPAENIEMLAFPMAMAHSGASGALAKMSGVPSGGNSVLVYFSCDDCANEVARVASAGGKIEREKMSIGEYGYIALVCDTEGNMIGLHSLK
jgi:uncharacterized protein